MSELRETLIYKVREADNDVAIEAIKALVELDRIKLINESINRLMDLSSSCESGSLAQSYVDEISKFRKLLTRH